MRRHIPLDLQDFVNDALKTELRKSVDVLGVRLSEWRTSIDTSLRIPIQHPHASADPQNCFGTSCREERHPTPAPCGDIPHWLRRICWIPAAGQNLAIFTGLSGAGHRGTPPPLTLCGVPLRTSSSALSSGTPWEQAPARGATPRVVAATGVCLRCAALHQARSGSKDTTNIAEFRTPGTRCVAIPSETFATLE